MFMFKEYSHEEPKMSEVYRIELRKSLNQDIIPGNLKDTLEVEIATLYFLFY